MTNHQARARYLRSILDAIPNPVFVVDRDVRVLDFNEAARPLLSEDRRQVLRRRGGQVLHCLHAHDHPAGCGHGAACRHCALRGSVNATFEGRRVIRARAHMQLLRDGNPQDVYLLVTTAAVELSGEKESLLILEDISDVVAVQRMLPICSSCKRIRDDNDAWRELETFFKDRWDMDFSHSLCPECLRKLYGGPDGLPEPPAAG